MKDCSFEVDEFAKGKIYDNSHACAMQLYILLINQPGDWADDLDKGIGLLNYRVGIADDTANELTAKISEQVSRYCDFVISDLAVMMQDGQLHIGIESPSFRDFMIFSTTPDDGVLMAVANA